MSHVTRLLDDAAAGDRRAAAELLVLKPWVLAGDGPQPGWDSIPDPVRWSHDGSRLLAIADDGTVQIWDARPLPLVPQLSTAPAPRAKE